MHDLTAQVTSSLLPFPEVTVNALGEDEIILDSVLHGKFTVGRSGVAWLACGPHLEAVHAVTGERLSAYTFSGGGEHAPTVLAIRDFSWLKRSGLLVGLEEAEGSVLCLYDLGLSRVVKAVVIPGRITAIEPLVSYGGASTSTQHLHQSLRWFFGIAAVVTDLGHVLLVDLCLDDLSCSQSELEASDLQVVTKSPAEIPRLREASSRQGRHLCLQLNAPTGVGATALQYISRTNQLAVGFSDGYLQLWNMKALKKEYHSQLEGGRVPVYAFTFQEPENDPRNCCYLWAVQSSQDLNGDVVSLRLLQLAFGERKCLASGKILYEGLEYCEERYSQELNGTSFPLRAQATNTRLLNCQTIEKFRPHPDRDDSMNEVASPDTSVSIFSWQVKAYGQGMPATFIGVFDINRWYHAQMPDSLRTGESLQNCPYLAVWSLDPVMQMVSPHVLLDVVVHDRSLSRGLPFTCPPPEQYFNPTTYNFDATCLLNSGIVHLTCSGYQKETLSFLKKAAPCSSDVISTSYSRCLMSGLLSSRLADTQASSLSQEEQLDAILSTAVETSSLGLITGCIKQWTAEEQPGSALNLRYILDWAWNKVVQTKEELDGICAPLFDSSSNFTDPQTMQLLQHSQRLLSNLSTIFHCLLSEAQELTQKGLVGLMNKNMVSSLISKYAQVVLWFCRTGLLPEGPDDDALQISRPFYTHAVISSYYTIRREELTRLAKGKWCPECLMIDGLVGQCGESLANLWKRDEGGTGQYPPPTLHALLDIYLLDNIDEATKHAIVIYLLLDVMYSFPNKEGASVESFPTAFAIPIGLVKLVQGLWLLDHHDHQSSFELLLHPAASQCQFEWQHERVLQALMCQGQHSVALRYFHVTKPPISSTSQAKLCLSVLLHNRCLIEAWTLIRQHSSRLNMGELLGFLFENCQELGLIKELLKLPLGLPEQECLEKFLQGTGGLQNRELLMVHYLQQANYIPALQLNHSLKVNLVNERDPKLKERSNTRNSILDQYGKVLPRVQRKLAMERAKPYQHPGTILREVSRPKPLSTITKRSAGEKAMSRAGFINSVLTKIEEVWLGKGATPQSSPAKSPRTTDIRTPSPNPSSLTVPDPFLGTPITMTSKRKSRLMELVVHPSCQTPRPIDSPLRPPVSWVSPKSIGKAPELSLLKTPQVVKRARALAASGPVFSAFTPQSILRSSLRPTPVATPSASPGRSITPPLRNKENRITFIEEAESPEPEKSIRWTNGMAAESEISLLTRGTTLPKATHKTWSPQPAGEDAEEPEEEAQPHVKFLPPEGGIPSPQLRCSDSDSSSIHEVTEETGPSASTRAQVSQSFDTSHTSVLSAEYYDAPVSQNQEEEGAVDKDEDNGVVIVTIKTPEEKEELEQESEHTAEQAPLLLMDQGDRVEEDKMFEDLMEAGPEQEDKEEEVVESEKEDKVDVESSTKPDDTVTPDSGELSSHDHKKMIEATESVTESAPDVELQDQPVRPDDQSETIEVPGFTEGMEPSEPTEAVNESEEDLEQPTDLTDFVQQHLFGSDLSPPLTRSGIHSASKTEVSFTSESLQEEAEEELTAAKPSLMLATQKSITSVTSSEPTGTDSHSVVSVDDSEELSSPASEEDDEEDSDQAEEEEEDEEEEEEEVEEEEEEEVEEEEEDSGSEVEIIEEVQGNGRLSPLQTGSVFVQQGQAHFLPPLSEQEAEVFSAEMKIVEEEMEGEVVMVRLGANEGGMNPDEDDGQGSSYMELKPSTTLLVPLELVEEQDGLVHSSQLSLNELHHTHVPNDVRPETNSTFSLMLDVDEDGEKVADVLDNNLLSPNPYQSEIINVPAATPEVILLSKNDGDTVPSEEGAQEELGVELEELSRIDTDKPSELEPQTELQEEPGVEMEEPSRNDTDKPSVLECVEPQGDFQEVPEVETDEQKRTDVDKPSEFEPVEPQDDLQDEPGVEMEEPSTTDVVKSAELQPVEPQTDLQEEPEVEMADPGRIDVDKPTQLEHPEPQVDLKDEPGIETGEQSRAEVDKPTELESGDPQEEPVEETEELNKTEAEKPPELEPVGHHTDLQEEPGLEMEDGSRMELERTTELDVEHQADLQNKNSEEICMTEDAEKRKEVELVLLAEDVEPPTVSLSEPTPAEEPPIIMDGNDVGESAAMTEALVQEEDDKATSAEDQKELEVNVPFEKNAAEPQSGETMAAVEEEQQEYTASSNIEKDNQEERNLTKRTLRTHKKVDKSDEEEPVQQAVDSDTQPEEKPVFYTPSSQRKKKAPSFPTRRTTRTKRTVSFIAPLPEESDETEEEGKVQEIESSSAIPRSPIRTPRRGRRTQEITVGTRRSARKVRPVSPKQEEDDADEAIENDATVTSPSSVSSPVRRKTRTSQRNQTVSEEVTTTTDEEIKEERETEIKHPKVSRRGSSKNPTPAKRRTPQPSTPRRSSRRILSSSDETSTPLEVLNEEEESAPAVRQSSRKRKTQVAQPVLIEVEEESTAQSPSPGRGTRLSNRNTLNIYPQVKLVPLSYPQSVKQMRGVTVIQPLNAPEDRSKRNLNITASQTTTRRLTRSKLWDHPEEDLRLLDSPLEVDSEIPVADALIKRLKDEEEKQEGAVVDSKTRASKRRLKSSAEPVRPLPPVQPPAEEESSPVQESFIYSPLRRRTRASREVSPGASDESTAPVTRSRRASRATAVSYQDEIASEEDHVEVDKVAAAVRTRKTFKRRAKSKAVVDLAPVVEVDLLSPLPSPAESVPRAHKRAKEADIPASRMNLRRKRIMDTLLTKPLTRRKKL